MKNITQNKKNYLSGLLMILIHLIPYHGWSSPEHQKGSSLEILLPVSTEHKVVLDNITYHDVYNSICIDQLAPGNHKMRILEIRTSRHGRIIEKRILYNGWIFVPVASKVIASIGYNGRLSIERTYRIGGQSRGGDYCENDDCGNRNYDGDRQNRGGKNGNYRDRKSGQNSGYNENGKKNTIEITIQAIRSQSFDSDRLKIAKSLANQNELMSHEVLEIMKLFSFESTRLEFAKYAYSSTIDKKNYIVVHEAFQFSSSISELLDYIEKLN